MRRKYAFLTVALAVLLVLSFVVHDGLWGGKSLLAKGKESDLVYVADVISIQGNGLKIKRTNSPHWLMGRVNMADYKLDVLETDGNTIACIEFHNGSQVGINKDTKIEIISDTGVNDITRRSLVKKIVLKSGAMWAKIRGKNQDFNVQTGKGTLGVKGTEFVVESNASREKVSVLEGTVDFTPAKGTSLDLTPGDVLDVQADKPLAPVKVGIDQLRKALNGQFPGMDPRAQMILGVFSAQMRGQLGANMDMALGQAGQVMDAADPEKIKGMVDSKINEHTGGHLGGVLGRFGGGESKPKEPAKVQNLKPDGGTIDTYYPKFTWDKVEGAKKYRVLVTLNPLQKDEKDPQYYMSATTDKNELEYPDFARALKPGVTYYWRVDPLKDDDKFAGLPSDTRSFTMADYKTMGIKGLFPSGDIPPIQGNMVFDWTPVEGVTKYKVEVSGDKGMGSPILTQETETNFIVLEDASARFSKDKEYYWKVTPVEGDPGISGVVNRFKVKEPEKK